MLPYCIAHKAALKINRLTTYRLLNMNQPLTATIDSISICKS